MRTQKWDEEATDARWWSGSWRIEKDWEKADEDVAQGYEVCLEKVKKTRLRQEFNEGVWMQLENKGLGVRECRKKRGGGEGNAGKPGEIIWWINTEHLRPDGFVFYKGNFCTMEIMEIPRCEEGCEEG